ncbi:aminodeoxychorismate/anthranilate synthase component II [Planctomycetes bacterium Poly30]|uniref:anthranilate synthase component II n=1 Tax=Saltatorellus ferox TaxID=2528018 RepID=UPI0011AAD083
MIVVIDNRDSFTFNLVHELQRLGAEVRVLRGRDAGSADAMASGVSGVLIGPGPGEPSGAGGSEEIIRARCDVLVGPPILGVCLGHQALATALGGRLRQATELVHGSTRPLIHSGEGLLAGLPSPFPMARYNSLVIEESTLPPALEITGRTPDGDIAAIRHRTLPLTGVQGHPESILSVEIGGRTLLENFVRLCGADPARPARSTLATGP